MDVWEQKLRLAESIAEYKFTDTQVDVFMEDDRDLAFFFFNRREGQTTVGLTYALVNAYWRPSSKYLYISDNASQLSDSKLAAMKLTKSFEQQRPERTYKIVDGNIHIGFGTEKSEVVFYTLNSNFTGDDYHAVILDSSYSNIRLKHMLKFSNSITNGGKLLVLAQSDYGDSTKTHNSSNKLDAIIDDVIALSE